METFTTYLNPHEYTFENYGDRYEIRVEARSLHPFTLSILPGSANGAEVYRAAAAWKHEGEREYYCSISATVNTDSTHNRIMFGIFGTSAPMTISVKRA